MVVVTNQMQHAMDNDPVEFIRELRPVKSGIFTHGINADKEVSAEPIPLTVVKGDDVCIIIVFQIFYIDIQNIIIGTKYNRYISQALGFTLCNKLEPTRSKAFFLKRKSNVLCKVGNHLLYIEKGYKTG